MSPIPANREGAVRAAFAAQAGWCDQLGSPLTARICEAVGRNLDRSTALGRRVLDWPGQSDALHDSVPLRLCGGLHALVRSGRLGRLARSYPPNPPPPPTALWPDLAEAFRHAEAELLAWLDQPPQTNEVARSAVLMAGLAVVAAETGRPLALHELGASAGLNLLCDRYAIQLGGLRFGDPGSGVRLAPDWEGPDPPHAPVRVASRQGVDIHPLDATQAGDRERLLAYVWPDQTERLDRLQAALAIATREPVTVHRADAADWLVGRIGEVRTGEVRVVMHSIAFQYFPERTQTRIAEMLGSAGEAAPDSSPLAWLRYEMDGNGGLPSLRLRLWPDGSDRLLARAHPHGRKVVWLA